MLNRKQNLKSPKIFLSPLTLVLFFYLFVCCRKEAEIVPEVILAKEELSCAMAGEVQSISIKSNVAWEAASSEGWCVITPSSGSADIRQLKVTVSPNTSNAERQAVITLKAGSLVKEIKVVQAFEKLELDKNLINVEVASSEFSVNVQSTASYTYYVMADWIKLTATSADQKTQTFTVSENTSIVVRTGKIIYKSGNLMDTLVVKQARQSIWVQPDAAGMTSDAKTLASKIFLGWNLGNSLEVPGGETGWGNPNVSQTLIDSVKAAGFNAIRIPCAWNSHLEDPASYKIYASWLARVKEVVDYCYKNSMYVIINIHWDEGWLEEHPFYKNQVAVNEKQKALWEQIAVYFRDYDEHLMFAGTNEVRADYGTPSAENITVQLSYNQTFVDAVRSTGGKNAYRTLIVQAYNTNINHAVSFLKMPTDNVTGRMMAEVHYYDPWDFCGDAQSGISLWGTSYAAFGKISNWGQESHMDEQFAKMKTNFVDKGFPVILGEYGAMIRSALTGAQLSKHKESRAYYFRYLTQQAKNNGLVPFVWDNGFTGNQGMGLFDRPSSTRFDVQSLNALLEGATAGKYPF